MNPDESAPPGSADAEIAALIETLHRAGQRLEELTGGEVDAVADLEGRPFLLRHVQERSRRNEAARQAAVLDALPANIAQLDTSGVVVSVNEAWRLFASANGLQSPACGLGLNYLDICDQATGDGQSKARIAAEGIRSVLAGDVRRFSTEYPCDSPTEQRWFQLTVTPLGADHPLGAIAMHTDISERQRSEAEFRILAEAMPQIVWITRADGRNTYFSQQWMDYTGLTLEESLGHGWDKPFHPDDKPRAWDAWRKATAAGRIYSNESRLRRADGVYHWWLIRGAPLKDASGRILKWFGTCTDIHDLKIAELQLAASLKEKDALLQEVHHRVKNNLQVITSLLRLESNRIDHPATRAVLKDMQSRILAMAVLHETIYRSGNFAQVDMTLYLKQLTAQLQRSHTTGSTHVGLDLDLSPLFLDIDQAVPCGLILNELVSNALKHGFPAGRSGSVRVELKRRGQGAFALRVVDDGVGLPRDFATRRSRSLGLQMVSDLAKQMQGHLAVDPGPVAAFEVTFTPTAAAKEEPASGS